jgi:hypothetical protein
MHPQVLDRQGESHSQFSGLVFGVVRFFEARGAILAATISKEPKTVVKGIYGIK